MSRWLKSPKRKYPPTIPLPRIDRIRKNLIRDFTTVVRTITPDTPGRYTFGTHLCRADDQTNLLTVDEYPLFGDAYTNAMSRDIEDWFEELVVTTPEEVFDAPVEEMEYKQFLIDLGLEEELDLFNVAFWEDPVDNLAFLDDWFDTL